MKGITMKKSIQNKSLAGFAAVEAVLIVVVVAAFIGVGGYVLKQNHNVSSTISSTPDISLSKSIAPSGSAASLDQSAQLDAQTETNVDNSADGQTQQNAVGTDSAIINVGGSYDENTL